MVGRTDSLFLSTAAGFDAVLGAFNPDQEMFGKLARHDGSFSCGVKDDLNFISVDASNVFKQFATVG